MRKDKRSIERMGLVRGKGIRSKGWIEGYLIVDERTEQYFIHAKENSVNEKVENGIPGQLKFIAFEVDPDTICQYTGLCGTRYWGLASKRKQEEFLSKWNYVQNRMNKKEDWRGIKIFEGDIVESEKYTYSRHRTNRFERIHEIGVVHWHPEICSFLILTKTSRYSEEVEYIQINRNNNIQVIGNVFDNQELANLIYRNDEQKEVTEHEKNIFVTVRKAMEKGEIKPPYKLS